MTNPINVDHVIQQALLDGMSIDAAIKMASDKALAHFERVADARNEDEATGEAFTARFNGPIELTGDELDNFFEGDMCVGSDEGCQCEECRGLTEDEKMAQAGASDEEIATANYIDKLEAELAELRGPGVLQGLYNRFNDAAVAEMLGHGDPVDGGDFGAGIRGESLGERIVRLTFGCHQAFDEAAEFAKAQREAMVSLDEAPPEVKAKALAAFMGDIDAENGAEEYVRRLGYTQEQFEADCPSFDKPVRDCDVPATLRAIDIYYVKHGNAIQQWFYDHDAMCQFLAERCLFIDDIGCIKDEEGDHVGMWFYAHFSPTPVS